MSMPLPAAVARKVEKAAALMRDAQPAPDKGIPAPGTPAGSAPAGDVVKLAADLKAAQAETKRLSQANRVLQEKFNAEVPRFAADLKTAKERVAELEGQVKRKVEAGEIGSLSDTERQLIGPDVVTIIAKAAREIAAQEFDARIKPFNDRMDQFKRLTEEQYFAVMDELVPDWEAQNDDPRFIAWSKDIDPESGRLRDDLLQRAHAAQQGYRVAEIFRAYKEGREIGARGQPAQPGNLPNIEPGPGSGNPNLVPAIEGKIWSRGDIKRFYDDKSKGKYRGAEGEKRAKEVEDDIFAARREGRITN